MPRYRLIIYQCPEGGYLATVPALPGCHTQADSIAEAEQAAREAVDLYLASLAKHNESIPEDDA